MRFTILKKNAEYDNLYIRLRHNNAQVHINTGIKVNVAQWTKANSSMSNWEKYINTEQGKSVNERINLLKGALDGFVFTSKDDKKKLDRLVAEVLHGEAMLIKKQVADIKAAEKEKQKANILKFYEDYVVGITSGEIRHGSNKRYKASGIKAYHELKKFLYAYVKKDAVFDDINKRFVDGFVNMLENMGLMASTIRKQIITFRRLCNAAAEDGLITNMQVVKVWKEHEVKADEKRAEIYLTDEEIDALYNMPLQGRDEAVRDSFMLGCLSCQRYSDFSHFTRENFIDTGEGVWVIRCKQEKTGTIVEVPIIDERVMELAEKYDFNFPHIDLRRMNEHLRSILKRLSADVPSLAEKFVTLLTIPERKKEQHYIDLQMSKNRTYDQTKDMKELRQYALEHNGQPLFERNRKGEVVKQKWELVTSHTARRSGVTNLYKTGLLDTREMMSISGHRSEKVFEKYIKMTTREKALRVAEKLRQGKKK